MNDQPTTNLRLTQELKHHIHSPSVTVEWREQTLSFMGKYLKGILGPFSGLVGTVVGATWKGIWVMRSRPVTGSKPPTEAQLVQRARFTLISQFLSPLNDLLKVGFQAYSSELTPFNAAFAANIDDAITGTYLR